MTYDYFAINFPSVVGFLFLLVFLYANASLDHKVKRYFYLLVLVEFIEMLTYSLELWTTTFATLSPLRLWLSAIGYTVRPIIFCLMLMLALRHHSEHSFPKIYYLPVLVNAIAAFSVFFTDIVYSYTPDNLFQRGPLGYVTYYVVILYLIILMIVVTRTHSHKPKLETMIIFAISFLLFFSMAIEAAFAVRTIGRSSIIMVTIFYYMFFQTQHHEASIIKEQLIRTQLEYTNRIDGSTGVLNKNAFADAVKNLLQPENAQHHNSIGFIFLDLDRLKELNDTLGHSIGDIAILDAVDAVRRIFRKNDLIGRFGGDEFYILLPDITRNRLLACLQEVQDGLRKDYTVEGITITITASLGAVYTEMLTGLTYEQLVHTADEALYEAKATGRNCHILKEL